MKEGRRADASLACPLLRVSQLSFCCANKYFTSTKWTATDSPTNKFYRSRKFKCLNLIHSITTAYTVAGLENAYLAYVRKFCKGIILRMSHIEKKMKFRLVFRPMYFKATPPSTWDQAHLLFLFLFFFTALRRLVGGMLICCAFVGERVARGCDYCIYLSPSTLQQFARARGSYNKYIVFCYVRLAIVFFV